MPLSELYTGARAGFACDWYSAIARRATRSTTQVDPCRRILVVNGHPDPRPERLCAALCAAYVAGAQSRGWQARQLNVGGLVPGDADSSSAFAPRADVACALGALRWADRFTIVFPLWLDRPPMALVRLFELACADSTVQLAHPYCERPARVVVTMEMPAFAHRAMCRGDAPNMARTLSLTGVAAREPTFIGSVDTISPERRTEWLRALHTSGASGS